MIDVILSHRVLNFFKKQRFMSQNICVCKKKFLHSLLLSRLPIRLCKIMKLLSLAVLPGFLKHAFPFCFLW